MGGYGIRPYGAGLYAANSSQICRTGSQNVLYRRDTRSCVSTIIYITLRAGRDFVPASLCNLRVFAAIPNVLNSIVFCYKPDYTAVMTDEMKHKLDIVMNKIMVLGDGLLLSHTGFIKLFRYDDAASKLTVFTDFSSLVSKCPSCLLMSMDTQDRVIEDLSKELLIVFPETELIFN